MKVLMAEDDEDIALAYKTILDRRNFSVTIVSNGEDCLRVYNEALHRIKFNNTCNQSCLYSLANNPPFDIVILDYKMPHINGLDVAKEILSVNPHQRIIFASAYVKEFLEGPIKSLSRSVELIQKPFSLRELIDILEDNRLYSELQRLNIDVDIIKAVSPTHEQIIDLLGKVKQVKKRSL